MTTQSIKHVDDATFEITRIKHGKGFRYIYKDGRSIKQTKLLGRLKKLVIPPMWTDVLISQWEDGHVQATGRDKKGRKQYIYHDEWEKQRQQEKFNKMYEFGLKLPLIRKKCETYLNHSEWSKEKVLALLVSILDETGIRIGHQKYTDENQTYGLTTLRRKHIEIDGDELFFNYLGKSSQEREVNITDSALIKHIKVVAQQPGYEIFRYQEAPSQWVNIDSDDVNEFIHEIAGNDFYSKDFRTWVATRLAVEKYPDALEQKKRHPRKKMTNILLRAVADEIGNTPTVCKEYYVHPKIMQLIDEKKLPLLGDNSINQQHDFMTAAENIVLDVLKKNQ